MMLLAVETSALTGSLALVEALPPSDGRGSELKVIAESTVNLPSTHSERLMPSLNRLLQEASLSIRDVQGIALALGPGSFTGLRIGVSTVKGLAYALKVPVVGVSSLDALAQNLRYSSLQVCPVLDARKKEVYSALFRGDGEGRLEKRSEDRVLPPEDLAAEIDEKTLFLGNGLETYGELFERKLGAKAILAPPEFSLPRAVNVARLSLDKFQNGRTLDVFSFTPVYLRRSEAEIHSEKKSGLK